MLKSIYRCLVATALLAAGCSKSDPVTEQFGNSTAYFPDNNTNTWATIPLTELGWKQNAVPALMDYLQQSNTKSFMILVNGKIAMEAYFNNHTATDSWQWNSAGKTLTTAITGIAQQEGLLDINKPVNQYLGAGWTSAPLAKENAITLRHLLTMTSGLNDANNFVSPANLTYVADAGTRWSYHNVFQKLMDVVQVAARKHFNTYFTEKLTAKIGMEGFWKDGLIFTIYNSNTRSMARFGLLALHNGKWKNEQIVPASYFKESVSTSQAINPAYGYLWWLNGKTSYMVPGSQVVFPGALVPAAPGDMYAAMGAEDQRIYVVPSKQLVIIRMGNAADPNNPGFAVSGFDNTLWTKINAVIE